MERTYLANVKHVIIVWYCKKIYAHNIWSEWLLFNAKWAIVSYIITKKSYIFIQWDDDHVRFVQYANMPSLIFIVLAHWSNSVDMSLHSYTLTWFRANRSLMSLLNFACLAEVTNTNWCYNLELNSTEVRSHDLPHTRREL
jgi:hypothetical protein